MAETATDLADEATDRKTAAARPLHILHVVRRGRAEGGMENGIVNVTNLLPDRHRVSICALDSEETFSLRIQRSGTEYFLLPKNGDGIDWGLVYRLARLIRSGKVDLVHSHNWGTFLYSVLAAKLAGVPIVHGEHGKNQSEVGGDGRAKRVAKRVLGRRVDQIVPVCQAIADEWIAYGVPQDRVKSIPNGVDINRFCPRPDRGACRDEFGLPESAFLVGSVGRLDELKNYEVLVQVLGKMKDDLPDIHVAILGDGPQRTMLQELAQRTGIAERVHLLGFRTRPELFLAGLDIFILPSKYEGMSNVVLEAMSTALPIVCADLRSHREIFVPGREGEIVSPCSAATFAASIDQLYRDDRRRRELGLAARARILKEFSIEQMVNSYARMYDTYMPTRPDHSKSPEKDR